MSLNAPSVARCTEMHARQVADWLWGLPRRLTDWFRRQRTRLRRRLHEVDIERGIAEQEAERMRHDRQEVLRRIQAIEAEVRARSVR